MSYKIVIWDSDYMYSYNLMEYLNSCSHRDFKATAFTEQKALSEYIAIHRVDLILTGEDVEEDFLQRINSCDVRECQGRNTLIYLTEKREKNLGEGYIYKYQSVELIAKSLKSLVCKEVAVCKTGRAYGIYSPLGRCGKTGLARGLCQYFGHSLYVNMEEYSHLVDESGQADVFFYYLANENPEILKLLESLDRDGDGNHYLGGVRSYLDLRQITSQNIKWFLGMLQANTDYTRVVFDIGQAALSDLEILGNFYRVIVPTLQDFVSGKKMEQYFQNIKEKNHILEKNICVSLEGSADMKEIIEDLIEREDI